MGTVANLMRRFQDLDIAKQAGDALMLTKDTILELQKDQLLTGKGNDGQDLSPGYLEDPYFKTPAEALAYLAWKQKITPDPRRNPNAPNLFINGFLHSKFRVEADQDGYHVDNDSADYADINAKYHGAQAGLSPENTKKYAFGKFWSVLMPRIEIVTGLKMI